ncbi:MAG TPA: hypothetical protein VK913_12195 [Erythrobacter sp.]|nr:hypothetical protein [Erythrobacter sp.]
MSDRKTPTSASGRPEGLAPETDNSEQDERGEQAQDIAAEARDPENHKAGSTESRKAPSPGVDNIGGNETDLVDRMRRMEKTGIIDNGAFAGEADHDDEPSRYRDTGKDAINADMDVDADDEGDDLHLTQNP